jgi:hypothetical protein
VAVWAVEVEAMAPERFARRSRPTTIGDVRAVASKRATPLAITDDDLVGLLQLIRDADSVELKLTVSEAERRSVVAALEMDPLDAELRQVFFFDTPELTLYEHGVVARARRMQGAGGDSAVKLRPLDPTALPVGVRQAKGFGVEVDAMPGAYTCSGSMKNKLGSDRVRDAIEGKEPLPHRGHAESVPAWRRKRSRGWGAFRMAVDCRREAALSSAGRPTAR